MSAPAPRPSGRASGRAAPARSRPSAGAGGPVDRAVRGEEALETQPVIRHLLVRRPASAPAAEFERRLFLARRRIEHGWARERLSGCYIPSFSSRTIVYKGLLVAPQLSHRSEEHTSE